MWQSQKEGYDTDVVDQQEVVAAMYPTLHPNMNADADPQDLNTSSSWIRVIMDVSCEDILKSAPR
jgi:hypothetical protein